MDKALIKKTIQASFEGTMIFPEIVMALTNDGIESYHVDYIRGEARYYHYSGETHSESIDHLHRSVASEFQPEKLQALIKEVQAGKVKYPEFLERSASLGCAYYIVYMLGKKVRYFGRDGGEHLELFPGTK